jgi:hypothetical protein
MSHRLLVGITTSPRLKRLLADTIMSVLAAAQAVGVDFVIAPNFKDPEEDWTAIGNLIGPSGQILEPLVDATLREHVEGTPSLHDYKEGNNIFASEWGHRGIQHNTDRLYRHLIARGRGFFLTLQDDVNFCPRAVDRIYQVARHFLPRTRVPAIGAVSFYTPHTGAGACRKSMWVYPGRMFYGELALLWNQKCCEAFLGSSNPSQAHDLEVGRFFESNRAKWRLYGHSPCLAQHTGLEVSARGDTGAGHQRTTMNYRPTHDAVRHAKDWI